MINPAYFESLGNETLEFLSKAEKLKKEKNAVWLDMTGDFTAEAIKLCKDFYNK